MNNQIIFRFLSKEDVDAIDTYNGEIETREYIDIPYHKLSSPFNENDILTREVIVELREKAKEFEGSRGEKTKEFTRLKKEFTGDVMSKTHFFFRVNVYPSLYPITSGPELKNQSITVNQYLDVSGAWGGVRTTHGIHGFFTYDLDDTRTRTPNFYNDYGYWDGARPRETGGNEINKPKDIFINKFVANDDRGNLSDGNLNTLFFNYNRSGANVDLEYIDCSGGQATYTRGDDQGNVDFGADATCDGFEGVVDTDLIRYTRLGKLMPHLSLTEFSDRREEINFRGKGSISGLHIKMSECEFMYHTDDDELRPLLDSLVANVNAQLNSWANDREKKRLHKVFFGQVHNEILGFFKNGLGDGGGSREKMFHLITDLSSEPTGYKRYKR